MIAPERIRLVLASKDAILIAGLIRLFEAEEDFEVVSPPVWGNDVLRAIATVWPDILLLDLSQTAEDGLALLHDLKGLEVTTRTVFLTGTIEESELVTAVRQGVRGIVSKGASPSLIVRCIREVHAGRLWLGRETVSPTPAGDKRLEEAEPQSDTLTRREVEIVRYVSAGLKNKQIAERLHIGEGTVKTHLHQIYDKLQLRGRLRLGLYGRDKGPGF
jgi:two-component system nitrate/nitrite response regulator NarP